MNKLLFVCTENRLRSPTAESVFSEYQDIEAIGAGTNKDFELAELIISVTGQMDSLFSYWMSASFAVLVSSYIGKEHFNYSITLSISALYFLASLMFLTRYYAMSILIVYYTELAGTSLPSQFVAASPIIGMTRAPTFVLGFVITEVYLWHSYIRNRRLEQTIRSTSDT